MAAQHGRWLAVPVTREKAASRAPRKWVVIFTDSYTGDEHVYGPYLKAEAQPLARRIQKANEPDEHGIGGATVSCHPIFPFPEDEL